MVKIEFIFGNHPSLTEEEERSSLETLMEKLMLGFEIMPYQHCDPRIQVGYVQGEPVIRPYGCKILNVIIDDNDEMEAINPRTKYLPSMIQSGDYSARIDYTPLLPETRV